MCVCVCALRIVSRDKILRVKNTFIIIIHYYDYVCDGEEEGGGYKRKFKCGWNEKQNLCESS